MRIKPAALFATMLIVFTLAANAFAHHSMSAYDRKHTTTLKATITEFSFSNPHAEVYFDAKDNKGNVQKWTAESPNPYRLAKSGWTKDSIKPGDEVTVLGNPAKNGSPIMRLQKIILTDGRELVAYAY